VTASPLPPGWCYASTNDLFSFITSGSRGWAQHYSDDGPLFLRVGNLDHHSIALDLREVQHVTPPEGAEGTRTRVQAGDVLISITADVGMTALAPGGLGEAYINQHVALARPFRPVHAPFLAWYLASPAGQSQLGLLQRGATKTGLGLDDLRAVRVPFPPFFEQQRIVSEIDKHFSRLDAAVAALKRAQANLKRYRAAVLRAAVEGRLGWPGRTERHVTGALPPGWKRRSLGSLLAAPLRNGHSAKATRDGTGIPTLTLSAVTENDFSPKNIKHTAAAPARVADLWLEPDDILIERSNTPVLVGTAARFPGPARSAIFPDLLIRVRLNESVRPRFIEAALQAEPIRRYFRASAQGIAGTMPKIDQPTVENAVVPVPTLAEQDWIIEELERHMSVLVGLEGAVQTHLLKATSLRSSLLDAAFSGRLVPQDPQDEPASVLLERIRAERAAHTSTHNKKATRRKPNFVGV